MRLRSLILFQICKFQCEFDREPLYVAGDLGYDLLLEWIGIYKADIEYYVDTTYYLKRNKDDAYVEDKVTMGLLLLAGTHKVCPGNQFKYVILVCYKHMQNKNHTSGRYS